mmetsp:Transcript_21903/g.52116  ORF Transcript_21903/g.52116 Transcript_21903/m.52116 type:complete len:136 (+) Transcript_21903:1874-2281(+)
MNKYAVGYIFYSIAILELPFAAKELISSRYTTPSYSRYSDPLHQRIRRRLFEDLGIQAANHKIIDALTTDRAMSTIPLPKSESRFKSRRKRRPQSEHKNQDKPIMYGDLIGWVTMQSIPPSPAAWHYEVWMDVDF